ncbi:cobalamin 5'-phosphate synthase [Syntrophotalea acetylenivorans]|uniref:Adenosylcobinamide-GDP ribazoletransferase n=1 Tax=Syntrophotalea acetylenivorans TaxID=1842532 RepID=A0A1L3GNE9_9BACT|nr:adenosylcobinamide-GDP ribazoletransferase [Syntrophotalea acetylenivorans]APG27457.1 cobalamin 5'-phosphate synthase [Syntrophotalea acetylenivorans]
MKSLFAALSFLTVVPLPAPWHGTERELSRSPVWFPLVGALIGGAVALFDFGLGLFLPTTVVSTFSVLAMLVASGGLHMDGLADTADGFFSSRSRDRMLEIMRDSRSGPMGVMAICSLLLLKIVTLAAVPEPLRISTLILMPLAGRTALTVSLTTLPYARTTGGLAGVFRTDGIQALLAAAVLLASGWLLQSYTGLVAAMACLAVIQLMAGYSKKKIGGFTGDTLGATCELTELVPALIAVAMG